MKTFYTADEKKRVKIDFLPRHVAVIMDGNRRWAKKNCLTNLSWNGHWRGAEVLLDTVLAAKELGVKRLTAFGFSTENWLRPKIEVDTLIRIFEIYLKENRQIMLDEGVHFSTIGDLTPFPNGLKKEIELTKEATEKCKGIDFVVALNYGGRDELKRVIKRMVKDQPQEITEELIENYLDTGPLNDPDLLIRTSGEMRISNFLLWQLAYTEVYVTEVLWPDFKSKNLLEALLVYQKRERRHGK